MDTHEIHLGYLMLRVFLLRLLLLVHVNLREWCCVWLVISYIRTVRTVLTSSLGVFLMEFTPDHLEQMQFQRPE